MSQPLPVARVVGPVEADLACRKCGYNLRGMDATGRCPECGTPVGYSVQGDLLRFSDPEWLRGLRIGTWLILLGVLVAIVAAVLRVVLVRSVGAQSAIAPLTTILTHGLIVFGTWKLTEADPSGLGEDDYGAVRRFIRVALLIGIAGTALQLFTSRMSLPDVAAKSVVVINAVTGLIGIAGFSGQLVYLGRLARRLPDDRMASRARSLAWWIGVTYSLILLIGLAVTLVGPRTAPGAPAPTMVTFDCIGGIVGLGLIVAFVRYLLLIERFGKRLREEEQHARVAWAIASPSV